MSSGEGFMDKVKKQLQIITDKTGIDGRIILGVLGVAALLTLIGFLDRYITCLVGIVLPTYWSIKAIESAEPGDDKQWLTYWAVYAIFTFFDLFANFIMRFIPFYFFVKIIFLIWCFMPNTQGAKFLYEKFIKKIFDKYEDVLDKYVKKVETGTKNAYEKAKGTLEKNKDKIYEAGKGVKNMAENALRNKKYS